MAINLPKFQTAHEQLANSLYSIQSNQSGIKKDAVQNLYEQTFNLCRDFENACGRVELNASIIGEYELLSTLFNEVKNLAEDCGIVMREEHRAPVRAELKSYLEIRPVKEILNGQELNLRELMPLDALRDAYKNAPQREAFQSLLEKGYTSMHQVKGNCMYRGFYSQFLLYCLESKTALVNLINKIRAIEPDNKQIAKDREAVLGVLEEVQAGKIDKDKLLNLIRTNKLFDLGCIRLFKKITSDFLRQEYVQPQKISGDILNAMVPDLEQNCEQIEKMGEEAEQFEASLLANALDTRAAIASVFPNRGQPVIESMGLEGARETVHLLFRPGHYDILYKEPIVSKL